MAIGHKVHPSNATYTKTLVTILTVAKIVARKLYKII